MSNKNSKELQQVSGDYLYAYVRDDKNQIVATLAANKDLRVGVTIRNESERRFDKKLAKHIAAARADKGIPFKIPAFRWITPQHFVNANQAEYGQLEIPLQAAVEDAYHKLAHRASVVFGG